VADYGEPWTFGGDGLVDRDGGNPAIRYGTSRKMYDHAAECVNAMQGVNGLAPGGVREMVQTLRNTRKMASYQANVTTAHSMLDDVLKRVLSGVTLDADAGGKQEPRHETQD
jgi:hypothetical protein